jgi:hypothetical protein
MATGRPAFPRNRACSKVTATLEPWWRAWRSRIASELSPRVSWRRPAPPSRPSRRTSAGGSGPADGARHHGAPSWSAGPAPGELAAAHPRSAAGGARAGRRASRPPARAADVRSPTRGGVLAGDGPGRAARWDATGGVSRRPPVAIAQSSDQVPEEPLLLDLHWWPGREGKWAGAGPAGNEAEPGQGGWPRRGCGWSRRGRRGPFWLLGWARRGWPGHRPGPSGRARSCRQARTASWSATSGSGGARGGRRSPPLPPTCRRRDRRARSRQGCGRAARGSPAVTAVALRHLGRPTRLNTMG